MCNVNIVTGEVYHQLSDFFLPGFIPLQFSRTYRSSAGMPGPLGHGWTSNLDAKISFAADSTELTWIDSTIYRFPAIAIGAEFFDDGRTGMRIRRTYSSVDLQAGDGVRLTFEPSGGIFTLSENSDLFGNRIVLTRNREVLITQLVYTCERRLQLSYDLSGHLTEISMMPADERSRYSLVRYSYDAVGNL